MKKARREDKGRQQEVKRQQLKDENRKGKGGKYEEVNRRSA